ncbi:MAG: hypothetical protein NZM16_06395 [Thermoflexus sp.]|nr:hypothetical protein [Thermoflexus sp.]MCS6963656.1 hypothetical protein [Thermoflexus sp.]MDW8185577.1 hypothetical protein [Anaerolineae bacterium]
MKRKRAPASADEPTTPLPALPSPRIQEGASPRHPVFRCCIVRRIG